MATVADFFKQEMAAIEAKNHEDRIAAERRCSRRLGKFLSEKAYGKKFSFTGSSAPEGEKPQTLFLTLAAVVDTGTGCAAVLVDSETKREHRVDVMTVLTGMQVKE